MVGSHDPDTESVPSTGRCPGSIQVCLFRVLIAAGACPPPVRLSAGHRIASVVCLCPCPNCPPVPGRRRAVPGRPLEGGGGVAPPDTVTDEDAARPAGRGDLNVSRPTRRCRVSDVRVAVSWPDGSGREGLVKACLSDGS